MENSGFPGKGRGTRSERAIGRGRSRFLTVSRLIVSAERLNERLENWHRSQPSDELNPLEKLFSFIVYPELSIPISISSARLIFEQREEYVRPIAALSSYYVSLATPLRQL